MLRGVDDYDIALPSLRRSAFPRLEIRCILTFDLRRQALVSARGPLIENWKDRA